METRPWVARYHDYSLSPGTYFSGVAAEFNIRVFRLETETQVMVRFPDNPIARDSVTRYITALKSVYARVADAHAA